MEKANKEILDDNIRLAITYLEHVQEKFIAAVDSKCLCDPCREELKLRFCRAHNELIDTIADVVASEIRGWRINV